MNYKSVVISLIILLFISSFGAYTVDASTGGGKFGNALELDGTGDYVMVPDSPSLRLVSTELTIEAWVYIDPNATSTQMIVRKWLDLNGGWGSYVLGILDGKVYGGVMNKALLQFPSWVTNGTVAGLGIMGTWAHIAFTWKMGNFTAADGKIYINGQGVATTFVPEGYSSNFAIGYSPDPLYFGRRVDAFTSSYYMGGLDEVRISNISRSSFSLTAPPASDAYTIGLWHFDEGTGTAVSDSSPRGNHGTIFDADWAGTAGGVPSINGRIAFESDRDGNVDIYVMNPDGTGQTRLTINDYYDGEISWSPDGTKIAFATDRDGNYEIYVMNADGTGQTRLTNNAYGDYEPDWSPDGSKIAFISSRDGNAEVYVMNTDGSGQTRLTSNAFGDDVPAWSPDGTKIAFATDRDGNWEIYVMNADGSGQTRLTNSYGEDWNPRWSPDGSKITWDNDRDGNYEIYVMDADGSAQTRLTNNLFDDGYPAFSPDGSKIVFDSNRDISYHQIYVMDADGSDVTKLTNVNAYNWDPVWQILYVATFQETGVGTDFSGSVLAVGGTSYTAEQLPASFAWVTETPHDFSWSSPLSVSGDKRYVWSSSSGLSNARSGTMYMPFGNGSIAASYTAQYYVTFQPSSMGTVSKASGWYGASSTISVSATPANGCSFTGWSVSGSLGMGGAGMDALITVNGPGTVTANFALLDVEPPSIASLLPANGSTSTTGSVTIGASYSDNVGVNPAFVVLKVDGSNVTTATVTTSSVSYNATLAAGSHSVELTVKDTHGNPRTATWSFTVQEPPKSGCFIATATYGSEAAPQVQALRDFRDGIAMKTFAGSNFMTGFLTWYYSWSPPVANSIASDSNAKAAMRVALQPLLNILDVATVTFSALSFNSEFAIVATGFVAATLIGLVYFLPMTTLALLGFKRFRSSRDFPCASKALRFTAIPWLISVVMLAVAEIALAPNLIMAATLAFVFMTIVLTVGTTSLWLVSFYKRG